MLPLNWFKGCRLASAPSMFAWEKVATSGFCSKGGMGLLFTRSGV